MFSWIAVAGGLVAMIGWGIEDFLAKGIVEKAGSKKTLLWTQLISLACICFIFVITKQSIPPINILELLWLFIIGVLDYIAFYFFWKSLEKNDVSIIGPIVSCYACFSPIISTFFFHTQISLLFVLLSICIIIGISLAISPSNGEKKKIDGLMEAVVSLACFSIFFPLLDQAIESSINWLFALLVIRLGFAISAVFMSTVGGKKTINFDYSWLWSFVLIAICNLGAYIGVVWAYHNSPMPHVVTAISSAYSLPTLILARIFFKEKLNFKQLMGVFVIVVAIILLPFV
jgi:drug/metabolite transporter (DMT)-like permease